MKTAILLPNWVGDACMATPALRAIRKGMPQITELALVGRYAPVTVLEGMPGVDRSIIYKPRSRDERVLSRRGAVADLKQSQFDTIILFPNSLSAGLLAYLSGIETRIGYATDGRSVLLTDRIPIVQQGIDCSELSTIDYYLKIAEHLGCSSTDKAMELWVSEPDRELARQMLNQLGFDWNAPTILINFAAATADSKQWPAGHASRTARELAESHGLQVLIHAGPGDREKANAIEFAASHPLVRSMGQLAQLPIGLSKAAIEHATVVVSTDSGPRHIAAALNKPVISLFGPTDASKYATHNSPEKILQIPLACSPCGKYKCPLVHNNCMHGLTHSRVVPEVLAQLDLTCPDWQARARPSLFPSRLVA
jgi:heptosyltransferase II